MREGREALDSQSALMREGSEALDSHSDQTGEESEALDSHSDQTRVEREALDSHSDQTGKKGRHWTHTMTRRGRGRKGGLLTLPDQTVV